VTTNPTNSHHTDGLTSLIEKANDSKVVQHYIPANAGNFAYGLQIWCKCVLTLVFRKKKTRIGSKICIYVCICAIRIFTHQPNDNQINFIMKSNNVFQLRSAEGETFFVDKHSFALMLHSSSWNHQNLSQNIR
jgi:hypothetical protein